MHLNVDTSPTYLTTMLKMWKEMNKWRGGGREGGEGRGGSVGKVIEGNWWITLTSANKGKTVMEIVRWVVLIELIT